MESREASRAELRRLRYAEDAFRMNVTFKAQKLAICQGRTCRSSVRDDEFMDGFASEEKEFFQQAFGPPINELSFL